MPHTRKSGRDLTLKSIPALLSELETDGKIVRFVPKSRKAPQRRLYLSREAEKDRNNPYSAVNLMCGKGYTDAALAHWSLNGRLYLDEKGKPRFLKELDPPPQDDVWEVRVVDPKPQARLLGAFIEQDTLILMRLHTRPHLGDKGSANWDEAINACASKWVELFGDMPRLHGPNLGTYVSENFDDYPLNR